jgi:putative phosphoribosyl transferase
MAPVGGNQAVFTDRNAAGRQLAERLTQHRGAVVIALPRGGVPVAAEIARMLDAPLDLMLVRKVGLPGQEELALGAIAGVDGEEWVANPPVVAASGLDAAAIRRLADREREELRRRRALYLGDRAPLPLAGRTVILVDDGIATGSTIRAAIQALRRAKPGRIVVAIPVAPVDAVTDLRELADEVLCLAIPQPFFAVGAHYVQFPQVSDTEVLTLLRRHPAG